MSDPSRIIATEFYSHPWTKQTLTWLILQCILLITLVGAAINEYQREYEAEAAQDAADTVIIESLGIENVTEPIVILQKYHRGTAGTCNVNIEVVDNEVILMSVKIRTVIIPKNTDTPLSDIPGLEECFR